LDKEPAQVEMKFSIPIFAIIKNDVESLMLSIDNASDSGIESLVPQIYSFLNEVCELSGQVVGGKGQPIRQDNIL
jgi:hypothetical protein